MTTTAIPGPSSIEGLKPPFLGPVPFIGGQAAIGIPENPDFAPNLMWMGFGLRDPRFMSKIGGAANVAGGYPNQDCGWYFAGPGIIAVDQVPSAIATNNIAAAATVTNGTAMTLVSSSGAGITVLATAFTVLPTSNVAPVGALAIDGNPAWTGGGTSGAFAFFNPTNASARAISITAATAATGGAFKVVGLDTYGVLVHETITAVTNSTVAGKKTYKWIISITPQFTDTTAGHTYSVGTADIYGLPIYGAEFAQTWINWNNTLITANTGFTAGLSLASTSTATTADVRGTYAVQSASDGTKKLTIYMAVPFGVIASSYASAVANLLGVAQFAS